MSGSASAERMVGFVPYPEGEVLPPTGRDAIEDTIRYLGTQHPWDEVRDQVRSMDQDKILDSVQGTHFSGDLSLVERYLAGALDYCGRTGLFRSPIEVVMTIASVRFEVEHSRFFIGQELPSKPHINPTT